MGRIWIRQEERVLTAKASRTQVGRSGRGKSSSLGTFKWRLEFKDRSINTYIMADYTEGKSESLSVADVSLGVCWCAGSQGPAPSVSSQGYSDRSLSRRQIWNACLFMYS